MNEQKRDNSKTNREQADQLYRDLGLSDLGYDPDRSRDIISDALITAYREGLERAAEIAETAVHQEAETAKYFVEPAAFKAGEFIAAKVREEAK